MKKRIVLLALICGVAVFSSCETWFDVQPKTQVKGDDLFATESGYRTALLGVYTLMASNSLYGEELSMELLDVLAQYYSISSGSHGYYEAKNFNYDSEIVKAKVATIWLYMYKGIANLNNLLENIEANRSKLGKVHYTLIKGEALGLRAYLHFDLLRMFAPACVVGENEWAIPYCDELTRVPQIQLTTAQVLERILGDIDAGLACLKEVDVYSPERSVTELTEDESRLMEYRKNRMNYLALNALKARVLLWQGDVNSARLVASELLKLDSLGSPASPIFSLYSDEISENADNCFGSRASSRLIVGERMKNEIYETENYNTKDSRTVNFVNKYSNNPDETVVKYRSEGMWPNEVPLIRTCELYYILAECALTEEEALGYLNIVRDAFGLKEDYYLRPGLCDVEEEIYKEYRKTYVGEGQLFYYMKRKDFDKLPQQTAVENLRSIWCLRIPDNELEFGNIKNQ